MAEDIETAAPRDEAPKPSSPRASPAKFDRAMVEAKMRSDGWVTTEKARANAAEGSSRTTDKYYQLHGDPKTYRSLPEVARAYYPDLIGPSDEKLAPKKKKPPAKKKAPVQEEPEPWDAPAEPPKLPKAKSPPRRRAPPARRGSGYRSGASSLSEPLEQIAEASAAASDHASPTLGGVPSYVSRQVPATATAAESHVRAATARPYTKKAMTGTSFTFRYSRKAEREAEKEKEGGRGICVFITFFPVYRISCFFKIKYCPEITVTVTAVLEN